MGLLTIPHYSLAHMGIPTVWLTFLISPHGLSYCMVHITQWPTWSFLLHGSHYSVAHMVLVTVWLTLLTCMALITQWPTWAFFLYGSLLLSGPHRPFILNEHRLQRSKYKKIFGYFQYIQSTIIRENISQHVMKIIAWSLAWLGFYLVAKCEGIYAWVQIRTHICQFSI